MQDRAARPAISSVTVCGGTPYKQPDPRSCARGVDVLIATPGTPEGPHGARRREACAAWRCSCWTRPTACWTWAFWPDRDHHRGRHARIRARRCLFSATHRPQGPCKNNLGSLLRDPAPSSQIAHKGETAKTVEQFIMPIGPTRQGRACCRPCCRRRAPSASSCSPDTKNRTEDLRRAMLCDAGFRAESIHSDKTQGAASRARSRTSASGRHRHPRGHRRAGARHRRRRTSTT